MMLSDGGEIMSELFMDWLWKGVIVVVAVLVLAVAMTIIWKKFGR